MDPVDELIAIERIKQLKARYFRLCDTMQLEPYLDVFTADAALVYDLGQPGDGPLRQHRINGRDELAAFCRATWPAEMAWSAHHGMTAEIEIVAPAEARGIWAMQDYAELRDCHYHGFGHYHESYRREADGKWRISSLHLTRTRVIETPKAIGPADAVPGR